MLLRNIYAFITHVGANVVNITCKNKIEYLTLNSPELTCDDLLIISASVKPNVPVNAMFPANKDVNSPQPHQDRIPVVVMAQEGGDEEGEEDGDRPGEKQPRETHLLERDASKYQHLQLKKHGHRFRTLQFTQTEAGIKPCCCTEENKIPDSS